MPILDSVKKQFRKVRLPGGQQKQFTNRLVDNFPALQAGFEGLSGSRDENDLLNFIYVLIEKYVQYRTLKPKKVDETLLAFRANGRSISKTASDSGIKLRKEGFEICHFDHAAEGQFCSYYKMPAAQEEPVKILNDAIQGKPLVFVDFHIFQREFHRIAEFLYACKEIIQPHIKIIINPVPSTGFQYYSDKTWYDHREGDIVVNELFCSACWDAIATRHTRILKNSIERIISDDHTTVNTIDPGYLSFALDDEDIYMAGYTPDAHRKFLKDFYTYNFPGTMSSMSLVFKDGADVFEGDLTMLSGFKKATDMKDKIWRELAFLRVRLLEGLMLFMPGIPVLTDTPAYPYFNSMLWKFRLQMLSLRGIGVRHWELIPYDDPQVIGLSVRLGRKRVSCWFNFVPEKRTIHDAKLVVSLGRSGRKDLLGQLVSVKKDHVIVEPYGLIIG